jgi:hypothetical protein
MLYVMEMTGGQRQARRLGADALLGWMTWVKSQPFTRDADDPIFDPDAW